MSLDLQTLLNAISATGAGSAFDLSADERYQGGAHSFEVSGSFVGSVDIEGSIDGGSTWHVLATFTDAGGLHIEGGAFTHVRGNVTAYTSGSITLKVRYGLLQDLASNITMLLNRLTSARAGYLDELAAANIPGDIDTLVTRLSSARAGLLDNLSYLDQAISSISADTDIKNLTKLLRQYGKL